MIVQNKQGLCDLIVLVREDFLSLREGGGQESSSPVCDQVKRLNTIFVF